MYQLLKTLLFFVILSIALTSCKSSEKDESITKVEVENSKPSTFKLSDIGAIDIDYIPLETKKESLITKISNFISDGDDFYVETVAGVLKFDSNGKFVSNIGKRGRGPQEYLTCADISIDTLKNIYILSVIQKKIFVYDNQGNFLQTIETSEGVTDIICFNKGILCYSRNGYGNIENSFHIVSYTGKQIKAFPNKYKFEPLKNGVLFPDEYLDYKWNNQIFIKEKYSDTIFSFSNMQFTPKIILDRGDKTMKISVKRDIKGIDDMLKLRGKYTIDNTLLCFGNYLYLSYEYDKRIFLFLYNFANETQYFINAEEGFKNNFDCGLNFYPRTTLDDNSIASWVSPKKLKAHIVSETFKNSTPIYPVRKKALEKLANSLDENDNPVLMLVKLKN